MYKDKDAIESQAAAARFAKIRSLKSLQHPTVHARCGRTWLLKIFSDVSLRTRIQRTIKAKLQKSCKAVWTGRTPGTATRVTIAAKSPLSVLNAWHGFQMQSASLVQGAQAKGVLEMKELHTLQQVFHLHGSTVWFLSKDSWVDPLVNLPWNDLWAVVLFRYSYPQSWLVGRCFQGRSILRQTEYQSKARVARSP